jgi:diacylglycerol kinase (ATP)
MANRPKRADRLLVLSPAAGGLDDEAIARIRAALPGFTEVEVSDELDVPALLSPDGLVAVAGGDGTVGLVARQLAGTGATMALIPSGTFDNIARALSIPSDLDGAIAVLHHGIARPVTIGAVGDHLFLEIAAAGFFGQTIGLGDSIKDASLRDIPRKLAAVATARAFDFSLSGDLHASGRALSLVVTNTPTTGANMPVGQGDPTEPTLELAVRVGATRADVVFRAAGAMLFGRHRDRVGMTVRFRSLDITTSPPATVYADNREVGTTPITVRALPGALRVMAPA